MDTKNANRRRRRHKSKDLKLGVCPGNENIKEKSNKSQPRIIPGLQTYKAVPAIEKQIVGWKRASEKNKSMAIMCQPKDEQKASNKITEAPQILNIHQRSVLEKSLKKNDNHIKTKTDDSDQTNKSNFNIHQLKVLEKLAQKKFELKWNSQKQRNNKYYNSVVSQKSNDKISDTVEGQSHRRKEQRVSSELQPALAVSFSRPPSHSIDSAAETSSCAKNTNWKTNFQETASTSLPTPKTNSVKKEEQSDEYTPRSSNFVTIKKNSAEKRLQKLRKRYSDIAQKEINSTQTLLGIGSPVSLTGSPASLTRSPVSITESPVSITISPVSVTRSPASKTKYNLLHLKNDLKARGAEKRLQKLRKRLSDPAQKEINSTQKLLGIGSPVSLTGSPASLISSPVSITESPVSITRSPVSVTRSCTSKTKYNLLQLKDDLKARASQSVEKRLKDFKKRLSDACARKSKSFSGPERESPNLQNDPSAMIIDNLASKRKSYETDHSLSKRTKVESLAQLLNVDAENIHPNGGNNCKLAKSNNATENSSICSSSAIAQLNTSFDEQMDWDTVVEQIIKVREDSQHSCSNSNINLFNDKTIAVPASGASGIVFIVVDTNIFISHLGTLEMLTDTSKQVGSCEYRIMVPWIVLCELDKLKSYSKDYFSNTNTMARKAMRFLHDNLSSNPKICGQSVKVANDHMFPCSLPDDQILNCCLQLSGSGDTVILLTNDINLCNKAAVNGIKMFTHKQFIVDYFELLHSQPPSTCENFIDNKTPPKIEEYDNSKADNDMGTLVQVPKTMCSNEDTLKSLEVLLHTFLSVVLEREMKQRFNELWTKVVLVEPPWSLSDILKCLVKHWIAVFKEVLPNEALTIVVEIQHFFSPRKKATFNNISEANFKVISSLGVKLVECFQINSKYSVLADECHRKILNLFNNLNKQKTSGTDENLISSTHRTEENPSNIYLNDDYSHQMIIQETESKERIPSDVPDSQISTSSKHIIGMLKIIWDGLCKFCTDLANTLEVSHNLSNSNDKAAPLQDLVSQASSVGNQLQLIISCTSRMIASFLEHLPSDQRQKEASLASEALTNILYDTICGMGHKSITLDSKDVLAFCTTHRNLLEEAHNKFIVLHNLIMECSQKYATLQTQEIMLM